MIAIALFINLLSHVSCQQTQAWSSYSKPSEVSAAIGSNVPGAQNLPNLKNLKNNLQSTFVSSQLNQRSNLPSLSSSFSSSTGSSSSLKPTSSQILTSLFSKISETQTIPSNSKPELNSKSLTYTVPPTTPTSQIIQTPTQISSLVPTTPSTSSIAPSLIPTSSPAITPSFPTSVRTSKRTIPSPFIESTFTYPNDPFRDIFELPEPTLLSVGCLDLTMTPYGTISETPLPDHSIPLPRSPFLPVSSPVSAYAPPFSPYLPPASPATRTSTFLRKVPFPPPFI